MNDFIKNTIIFLSISTFTILVISIGSYYTVKSQANFKVCKDINTLVIGHSHSEHSINDSILKNSINLSASGESYFYNYQKLKMVLDNNKQIKTVFVEFTNNQVDSVMNDWIWGYKQMSYRLQFYGPFMDSEDFELLLKHNPTDLFSSYSIATRKYLYRIFRGDYYIIDEIGGYSAPKDSKVNKIIAYNKFYPGVSSTHSLSKINIIYLRKMIDLCRKNNTAIFFIRSPLHPLYKGLSNETVYQNVLETQFNDVELLDFNTINLPNSHFLDLQHLNYKGAKEFTTLFNDLIKNNLLSFKNKRFMINESINEYNKKRQTP